MRANPILLQKKYSRVIECFAQGQGLSLDAALAFFYRSEVYRLDAYLAEELELEYKERWRD